MQSQRVQCHVSESRLCTAHVSQSPGCLPRIAINSHVMPPRVVYCILKQNCQNGSSDESSALQLVKAHSFKKLRPLTRFFPFLVCLLEANAFFIFLDCNVLQAGFLVLAGFVLAIRWDCNSFLCLRHWFLALLLLSRFFLLLSRLILRRVFIVTFGLAFLAPPSQGYSRCCDINCKPPCVQAADRPA